MTDEDFNKALGEIGEVFGNINTAAERREFLMRLKEGIDGAKLVVEFWEKNGRHMRHMREGSTMPMAFGVPALNKFLGVE